jgi:tight adherence protein B
LFLIVSVLLFLAIVLAASGAILHKRAESTRMMQERLRGLGQRTEKVPQLNVARDQRYSTIPFLDTLLRRIDVTQRLELMLYQAGLTMRVGQLVLLSAGLAMGGYFAGLTIFHRLAPAILCMVAMTPLPFLWVRFKKGQRMKAFAEEFPDALDLLVSALRAGLSFSAAMQIVAEESPEPVRGEFAITVEEQSLGLEFRDSLVNLTQRVDSLDLRFFVTAVILQRDTGGNLAEVLENTSRLIRDRFRILGDIKTFTAQGRLTGMILLALPIGITVFTVVMTPDYFRPMLANDGGKIALTIAGGMQLLGALVIRKIVNIKV